MKPERDHRFRQENYALKCNELNVITINGLKMYTCFFPARDFVSCDEWNVVWMNTAKKEHKLKFNEPIPTIIICNGDAGNMSYLIQYAKEIFKYGYKVK